LQISRSYPHLKKQDHGAGGGLSVYQIITQSKASLIEKNHQKLQKNHQKLPHSPFSVGFSTIITLF
jgi:hypothetical protein